MAATRVFSALMLFGRGRGLSTTTTTTALGRKNPVYVTTPIYYVNAAPHIGHAYTSIASDALARFAKLDGRRAALCTGTDEHGEKVEESALKAGETPLEFATKFSNVFRNLADTAKVDYDYFLRTTAEEHKNAVQRLWRTLEENGEIYLGSYEGWYCVRDECYYTEGELVDGKAPTGAEVEWRTKEPSYFFRLSKYQEKLIDLIESNSMLIAPVARRNEVLSFLKGQDLRDLSVSRTSFKWGIPVPGDDDHIVYVWLDALTNYVSAVGYGNLQDDEEFKRWWDDPTWKVHVVGKDILRFHAIYWPAICLAANLPCPDAIVAHGWWTKDGQKISKSLGNTVDPFELLETYGRDATRFFLLNEVPFGNDGDYSDAAMIAANNGYLANALGNFAQRVCSMLTKKPCNSTAPPVATVEDLIKFAPDQPELLDQARRLPSSMRVHLLPTSTTSRLLRFDLALNEIEHVVRESNKFFDTAAPWTLKKTDPDAMIRVLAVALELLRCVAIAYQPFMPDAAAKILDQIGVSTEHRDFAHIHDLPGVHPGAPIAKPQPVFPRIESSDDNMVENA